MFKTHLIIVLINVLTKQVFISGYNAKQSIIGGRWGFLDSSSSQIYMRRKSIRIVCLFIRLPYQKLVQRLDWQNSLLLYVISDNDSVQRLLCASHIALLPIGYFAQVVMWVFSDETLFNYQKSSQSFILGMFCH